MRFVYIIELGDEKSRYEMKSLELETIDDVKWWIDGSIEADADYYNIPLIYTITNIISYKSSDDPRDFHALGYIEIECEKGLETKFEDSMNCVSKIRNKVVI